jgi:ubiquinone/menaquinone biosynthesis C-methylase UbiE
MSATTAGRSAIYQHPLAYLLALQGIALLKANAGEHDRDFTHARLRDIRMLLDRADELGDGVVCEPVTAREVYAEWAEFYDEPGNALIDMEQPVVREILDGLPIGVALDAACGTGRHSAYLASLGHTVIGVDESPEMLDLARTRVPQGEFHEASLDALPLGDGSVELVVCALALTHVADLGHVLGEFARVLRPNGHLVLSDARGLFSDISLPMTTTQPDGSFGYAPIYSRLASDYLAAALPLGFQVRRCDELRQDGPIVSDDGRDVEDDAPSPEHVPGEPPNIWALHPICPDATNAAWLGKPRAIIWHFQLEERET